MQLWVALDYWHETFTATNLFTYKFIIIIIIIIIILQKMTLILKTDYRDLT